MLRLCDSFGNREKIRPIMFDTRPEWCTLYDMTSNTHTPRAVLVTRAHGKGNTMNTNHDYALAVVGTPDNPTAWMRDNARHGAMRYTRNGETFYVTGAPVVYVDADGRRNFPTFALNTRNARTYYKREQMSALD